jgi:hypothetical protein
MAEEIEDWKAAIREKQAIIAVFAESSKLEGGSWDG